MEDWIEQTKKLRSEGSFERTIAYLNGLLSENQNDPMVHYQIAWTHDALGKEADAAPAYEKAISLGLSGEALEGAYLGLGSTYRCLGDYINSERVLKKGMSLFPENAALRVFYALTHFNLKNYSNAVKLLMKELVRTSADEKIKSYGRALLFYSDKLNETFE
jgi:tetratricopeptide (TPR) repeat protein